MKKVPRAPGCVCLLVSVLFAKVPGSIPTNPFLLFIFFFQFFLHTFTKNMKISKFYNYNST